MTSEEVVLVNGNSSTIVVDTKPKITIADAIEFRIGKKVVGTVKATYNLKRLPARYHEVALGLLSKKQVVYWNVD